MDISLTHADAQRARLAQSNVAFRYVASTVEEAVKVWRKNDTRKQHASQIAAIVSLLSKIESRLETDFESLAPGGDLGDFYDRCAKFDRRAVWFERVWNFFHSKFAPRAGLDRSVLLAADEIVWSCYKQVFDGLAEGHGPSPLPFIEPRYSPEAFPSELVPPDLKSDVEVGLLHEFLNRMPVSVVRIPSICRVCPWWLVYLGHETGHHVQYDLRPQRGLVTDYADGIKAAVLKASGSETEAKRWAGWSKEIFADVFSVFCMGPWAVWAMLQLERRTAKDMYEERPGYPPSALRLLLLARIADELLGDHSGTAIVSDVGVKEGSEVLDAVVEFALGPLPGIGRSLKNLCDFQASDFTDDVPAWCEKLQTSEESPEPSLRAARLTISSSLAAWSAIAGRVQTVSDAERNRLAERTLKAIAQGSPGGERAADAEFPAEDLGQEIVDRAWELTEQ